MFDKVNRQRVVVTGLGVISPNGIGIPRFLSALQGGRSGIHFQPSMEDLNFRCQVAGIPPLSRKKINDFIKKYHLEHIISSGILYGCLSAVEAWNDAGLKITPRKITPDPNNACIFGTGSNGAEATMYQIFFNEKHHGGKLDADIPLQALASAVNIYINQIIGFGGQVTTNSSACSTGTEGILMAYDRIQCGLAKRILVGSSESKGEYVWSPFDAMYATSQGHNHHPKMASAPLSQHATGFVPGSGGGALVVESLGSAIDRNASIYAEILGGHINSGGQRGDGSMTIGNREGMVRCIKMAMKTCNIKPADIDLISGHLTSTIGDVFEIESWTKAGKYNPQNFPYINSTKSMIGHSLSASGSIESIAAILQLKHGFIHPSLNAFPLHELIKDHIATEKIPTKAIYNDNLNIVAKLSLGFGDVNACVFFKKWQ